MGEVSTTGLDIAKSVFQIYGVDADGAVMIRKRISRAKVLEFLFELRVPALSGSRRVRQRTIGAGAARTLGHTVRLMPPSYVKAYLKRSKNDANDAAAICEAVQAADDALCADKDQGSAGSSDAAPNPAAPGSAAHDAEQRKRGHWRELGIVSAKGRQGTADLLKIIADARR